VLLHLSISATSDGLVVKLQPPIHEHRFSLPVTISSPGQPAARRPLHLSDKQGDITD
jgi:hypothetical protein